MKFEAGQGILGKIRFADGAYPEYNRTYLVVEATPEHIVIVNVSSIRGKERKLAFRSNEKLRSYKPPFLKPSFVKLDSATKISTSEYHRLILLAKGEKLCENELIRIQQLLKEWQKKITGNYKTVILEESILTVFPCLACRKIARNTRLWYNGNEEERKMLERKVVVISENSYMHLKNVDLLERLLNNGYSIERVDAFQTNRAEEKAIYILSRECEQLGDNGDTQKSKAPFLEGDGYADGNLVYDTWCCPKCGASYELGYDDYDFCPKCGQKINWEGIER